MHIRRILMEIQGLVEEFAAYIRRNRYVILIVGFLTCLVHGDKLFSVNYGIDTEKIIFTGQGFYDGWLGIGRQGLVFLKWLMGLLDYNPYFAGLLALLFFLLSCTGFVFLFEWIAKRQGDAVEKPAWRYMSLGFSMIVITHPIMTEQLYFSLQGAEVTFSLLLLSAGLLFSYRWAQGEGRGWFLPAVVLLLPVFSCYQAMVPLCLFGMVAMSCIRYMGLEHTNENKGRQYPLRLATVFLCAFLFNQWITRLFFSKSAYLDGQVTWEIDKIGKGIRQIWSHVRDVVLGVGIFYPDPFFWLALGLLLLSFFSLLGKSIRQMPRWMRSKVWVVRIFLLLYLLASPFFLTVLLGERPVIRGQLTLPFTMGFVAYLCGVLLCREAQKRKVKTVFLSSMKKYVLVVCLLSIWQETAVTSRMYYTDAVRSAGDVRLATSLELDIARFTNQSGFDGTLVFVGSRPAKYNRSCLTGDVMGQSLFAWDTKVEPVNFWSSCRIVGFLYCMGMDYQAPTQEQAIQGTEASIERPCYPSDGSIFWCGDMIVIKLSNNR